VSLSAKSGPHTQGLEMPSQNMSPREHTDLTAPDRGDEYIMVWSRFPAGPYRTEPGMWLVERGCPLRYAVNPHGWALSAKEGKPKKALGREWAWYPMGVDPNQS